MYNAVIFDFDGTIADTFEIFFSIAQKIAREQGFGDITDEDIKMYRQKGAKALIKEYGIMPWKIPGLIKRGQSLFESEMQQTVPVEGIPEVLQELYGNVKLGIVTTNSESNVALFLEKHNLELFDFVYSASRIFGKIRTIKKALRKHNLKKKKAIYVGDELRDVKSAKKAGIDVAAVTWGYNDKEVLSKSNPTFVADQPEDLLKLHFFGL